MSEKLYLYQDHAGHRIYSKEPRTSVKCFECGEPMKFIATLPRREGESESEHKVRALAFGRRVK